MALVRASVRVGRRTKRLRLVGKRILAETPSQRRNRVVTNKQRGIRFVFLVMTNTWAIGRWVAYYGAGFS